jgi:hypothetical protein
MSETMFSPAEGLPPGPWRVRLEGWLTSPRHPEHTGPVSVTLAWFSTDPYAIRAEFFTPITEATGVAPVRWLLSRELLASALDSGCEIGLGDLVVWTRPIQGRDALAEAGGPPLLDVVLRMSTPAGLVFVELDAEELTEFLRLTFALVPAGIESDRYDIDAAIAAWLNGETA